MEYAVVKFINETTESDSEVVSEVPASWLTKNNSYCKWPSEKFASVYIAKKFGPKDDWEEFPVEVEYFCETHAEAKEKLKKKDKEETVGRGFRKSKPIDYFSPAEEDERSLRTKKKFENKDTPDEACVNKSAIKFISMCQQKESSQRDINISPGSPETDIDSGSTNNSMNNDCLTPPDATAENNNLEGNFITHAVIPENEVKQLVRKIDQLIGMMADFKIELATIKELMPDLAKKDVVSLDDELAKPFPLRDLEDLEFYSAELQNNEQERKKFMKFLRSVGGHDAKDWTYRLLKSIMTDTLAEACSWTGRKNNYEIRNLTIVDLLYRVVNQKTACTSKDFENYVAEWLRHAHTRKIRKDKKV